MRLSDIKRLPILFSVALVAAALTISLTPAYAQKHGGGGGQGGSAADNAGKGGPGGQGMGGVSGGGSQSLRDVFHSMESGSSSATSDEYGSGSKSGAATTSRGNKGSASTAKKGSSTAGKKTGKTTPKAAEEEDSDRPAWAGNTGEPTPGRGNTASGTKKGDIYGDMYVLLRDENGIPILNENGFVQPIGADGLPLEQDAEGNLVDASLAIPVDLGRLSVGRSPTAVLASQYDELLKSINEADSVSLDDSGRLVLTTDGVAATVDSPLANLALYVELLNTGTITGADPSKFATDISYLVTPGLTSADLLSAASFLAAAADKTGTLTIDKIVNLNTILGVTGTLSSPYDPTSTLTYVDYSSFNYDRQSVYDGVMVTVLIEQDGSYVPTNVNLYDAVFNSTNYVSSDGGIDGFAQAADDALQVIEYIHDNPVPTN
jgi:hypothetical protein